MQHWCENFQRQNIPSKKDQRTFLQRGIFLIFQSLQKQSSGKPIEMSSFTVNGLVLEFKIQTMPFATSKQSAFLFFQCFTLSVTKTRKKNQLNIWLLNLI